MKRIFRGLAAVALVFGLATLVSSQSNNPASPFALLKRANTWTALQTFNNGFACGGVVCPNPAAKYLLQQADSDLANAQAMGALGTGLVINTTTTGIQSIFGGTSCTNQVPTALSAAGAATCTTLTSAYVNNSIALTGTDINTSNQVTVTHLAAALPVNQGGTSLTTTTAGTFLVATTTNTISAVAPALVRATPSNQTAFSSSGGVFKMVGLGLAGCTITPVATGRVVFLVSGDIVNNTTATTVTVKIAEGTGTAPSNQGAAAGTVVSAAEETDQVTSVLTTSFSLIGTQTGLVLSTAVWFDLQLTTSGANTGQPTNVTCVAYEI